MRNASRSVAWERITPQATLLLLSLLAACPLWGAGLLNTRGGGDSPFLLLRTHQLAVNLRAGVFPVRWMPDAAYGFGYPFFSYYAALPYYVAAGFELLGFDILTAIKLAQTLFLAASALTMYRWAARALRSRVGGWLAAVAYTSTPFHLVNLYVRGDSLSEFAAFAFYPLILWGFDRLASKPSLRRTLCPALAYAGLIATHNVSALIFSPFILLYVALRMMRMAIGGGGRPSRKAVARHALLVLPLLMALLLSAWFWIPALAETRYVQLTAQTSGYFFYGNHFRGVDLIQPKPSFDYATGQGKVSPFAMGLLQAALALAGACIVSFRILRSQLALGDRTAEDAGSQLGRQRAHVLKLGYGVLGLLLSTWLITPLSRPVWDHIPLLPMVQFPWRFLSVQALFAALLTGAAVSQIGARRRYAAWAAALILGAALTTGTLIDLQPDYLRIRAEDVTVERLQLYELFTGNIGSTIRHEYLPRWAKPRPYIGPDQLSPDALPRAIAISGALLRAERVDREPTRRVWHVETGSEGASVAFPLYYWPGWLGIVDGTRQKTGPAAGSGYVSLYVPPGLHIVEIRLGRTPLRLAAEVASLFALLTIFVLCVRAWGKQRGGEAEGEDRSEAGWRDGEEPLSVIHGLHAAIAYLPFAITLSLVVALRPRVSATASQDLTMDFEKMPYLHHNPTGVSFDGWQISSYSYEAPESLTAERIAPGKTLQVTINWKNAEDRGSDVSLKVRHKLRLISPASVRQPEIPAIAEAPIDLNLRRVAPDLTARTVISLPVPQQTAPGVHLLQITGAAPVYFRPIWVTDQQEPMEEPVRATFADGALRLHDIQTAQIAPDRLHVQLGWSAKKPVAANYGLRLSLTDAAGNEWLRQDEHPGYNSQPGHGFLPSSLWPLNRVMDDHHLPAMLPGVPPGESYTLTIDLYRVATWESVGQDTMTVELTRTASPPSTPGLADLGSELALGRLETPHSVRQGEVLQATAYWSTLRQPSHDYVIVWGLNGPGRSITTTQALTAGSSPKGWSAGAWVASRLMLPIPPTFPPGDYALSITLREPGDGKQIGSYTHPTPVIVQGQERVWELPEMEHIVGARFGDMIELAGYDLREGREALHLTLYWQALATPDRHYKFFVHLADPGTGQPASQVDTMPGNFSYPTGQWVAGEVISDEVELPTKDAAAGRYDLAVGWYDPDTKLRLEAVDRKGVPLPDNRLLLPTKIQVR